MQFNYFLFILLFSSFSLCSQAATDKIILTVQTDVYEDYLCLLNERDPLDISDFTGACSRRDVVDIILLQQALKRGGLELPVSFRTGHYELRNRQLLEEGFLLVSVDTFWLTEAQKVQEHLYISEPILRKGEYVAGFYTSPHNKKALAARSLIDIQQLSGVSSQNWTADWQAMQQLGLKQLIDESIWVSQVKLVDRQFVDFMLAPFNVGFAKNNLELVIIPNIAVKLDDSRHYVISKNHPLADSAFKAINTGIAKMRQSGQIHKAYSDAGFFYAIEHKWKIINN
ncbi:hypothetical protein [Paraglaciecola hydrolytica]|uniref:hypothetical protein n=1 Tax=Paraglaciecola hydrolytica TaxID=1799789 RepID=UPI0009EB3C68|nr:hypothetical protein [Paraglaciecola hydrolytica]